jgi:hypothetical protein
MNKKRGRTCHILDLAIPGKQRCLEIDETNDNKMLLSANMEAHFQGITPNRQLRRLFVSMSKKSYTLTTSMTQSATRSVYKGTF